MADSLTTWKELAAQLRVDSIRCTTAAGSGHPTSGMSAADLMAVLLVKYLRFDWSNPRLANNDRLIFSKGHACPLLYSMFKAAGAISDQELLSLRKFGSRLEGHPNPHTLPYVDVATGSLGQGLGIGVGMLIKTMSSVDVVFSTQPMLLAFGCAAATGVIFGFAPARKAARLDPVVALANE